MDARRFGEEPTSLESPSLIPRAMSLDCGGVNCQVLMAMEAG